jgi:hypothetical protein
VQSTACQRKGLPVKKKQGKGDVGKEVDAIAHRLVHDTAN